MDPFSDPLEIQVSSAGLYPTFKLFTKKFTAREVLPELFSLLERYRLRLASEGKRAFGIRRKSNSGRSNSLTKTLNL